MFTVNGGAGDETLGGVLTPRRISSTIRDAMQMFWRAAYCSYRRKEKLISNKTVLLKISYIYIYILYLFFENKYLGKD